MTFKKYFEEAFVSPFVSRNQQQGVINTGPDIGMTSNIINNSFPSNLKSTRVTLPIKKKIKKRKKA
jgi:hypothetical protein